MWIHRLHISIYCVYDLAGELFEQVHTISLLTIHIPALPISLCYVMWMFASDFCILRAAKVNRKGTHKMQHGLLVATPCQRYALLDSEVPRFDAVTNDIGNGCMNSAGYLAERTQAFDAAQSSRFWECVANLGLVVGIGSCNVRLGC
jgi:hypothetical protein